MQFSTLVLTTLATLAAATPLSKRADCPEADNIPLCGVSPLPSLVAKLPKH